MNLKFPENAVTTNDAKHTKEEENLSPLTPASLRIASLNPKWYCVPKPQVGTHGAYLG